MRRAVLLLLIVLAADTAAQDDPRDQRWKQYHYDQIRGLWANEKLSEQRVVIVRGCERNDAPGTALWLMRDVVAKDEAGDVVREAVRVLSRFKRPVTVEAMADVWLKKWKRDWEARALTLLSFARINLDASNRVLAAALKEKDARVVLCACKAVGIGRRARFKDSLVKHLKHKDGHVRGAAAWGLAELRASETMPNIFPLMCRDRSHRVRYDAWRAMRKLALENLPADPEAWRGWWEKEVESIAEGQPNPWGRSFPAPSKPLGAPGYVWKIPVLGDRICFVIDASTSMDGAWRIDVKSERKKKREDRIPNFFSVKTRWDLVIAYVKSCLDRLPDKVEVCFSMFNFKLSYFPEKGRFLRLNKKSRTAIIAHLKGVKRAGGSMTYEAMRDGWGWLKDGQPAANFKRGIDTLILITDSAVKDGAFKDKADRVIDEVWRAAVPRNLVVHTIGLYNHDFALCSGIAKACGGLYLHAQPHDDGAEPQDLEFWPEKKKAWEAARKLTKKKG